MKRARIVVGVIVAISVVGMIATPSKAVEYGGGNVQDYSATAALDNGTIVQLTEKNGKQVEAATKSNIQNMLGVAVDAAQLPLKISSGKRINETYVAVSGVYNVLVSTENGVVRAGDYITLSSHNGIGMKAGTKESTVFGRANSSFNGKGTTLGSAKLKDSNGNEKTVQLGTIPVTVDVKRNPNIQSTKVDVPPFLERLGQQIAEKEVSPIRIYLSLAITFISLIAAIAVVYAGVRNSVISIGRNPMSKKSIFRALLQVIITALLILIVGLFAVYLLLKL
ncbi:MAG TPA: hypothetical protein VGE34_03850 [Candidatus Saccharimonadales bacterium]